MSAPEAMGTLLGGGSVVVVVDEASVLITLLGTEKKYGSSLLCNCGSRSERRISLLHKRRNSVRSKIVLFSQ